MEEKIKALIAWSPEGENMARLVGEKYAAAGVTIVPHGKAEREELISLGACKNMTHVLYFLDCEKLLLVSLADEMGGFTVEILVEDLILPC